jgi:hypothetical protein
VSRSSTQAADLKAAAKAVTAIGLDPVAILQAAHFAETAWKELPRQVSGLDDEVKMLAYALSVNQFELERMVDILESPSARKFLWTLRLTQAYKGGRDQRLTAISDAIRYKRIGYPASMMKEMLDRTNADLYREIHRRLEVADRKVPKDPDDDNLVRQTLGSLELPPLLFDHTLNDPSRHLDDLSRHLLAFRNSRSRGVSLSDQAALWLLESDRRSKAKSEKQWKEALATEEDLEEARRLRDRVLRAEARSRTEAPSAVPEIPDTNRD